jgi:hypothetical protein
MPNTKIVFIAVLVCAASLVFLGGITVSPIMRGNDAVWVQIIYLYLFSFLSFFYFFSDIRTIKRSLAYCIAIPFFCCATLSITYVIVIWIGDWKSSIRSIDGIGDVVGGIIRFFMIVSGGVLYFIYGWVVSVSLAVVCGFYLWWQKSNNQYSEKLLLLYFPLFRDNLIDLKWFKCNKFAFIVGIIYIIFMLFYSFLFEAQREFAHKVLPSAASVCLLSFFSVLRLAPVVFKKMKRLAASYILLSCCLLFPLFWNGLARTIYAVLIYIYMRNTKFFKAEILSADFYIHNYFEIKAWSISLLLILVCGVYYYFAKSGLARAGRDEISAPPRDPSV